MVIIVGVLGPRGRLVPQRRRVAGAPRATRSCIRRAPARSVGDAIRARDNVPVLSWLALSRPVPGLRGADLGALPAGRGGHRQLLFVALAFRFDVLGARALAALSALSCSSARSGSRSPSSISTPIGCPTRSCCRPTRWRSRSSERQRSAQSATGGARSGARRGRSPVRVLLHPRGRRAAGDGLRRRQARRRARAVPRLARLGHAGRRGLRRLRARRRLLHRPAAAAAGWPWIGHPVRAMDARGRRYRNLLRRTARRSLSGLDRPEHMGETDGQDDCRGGHRQRIAARCRSRGRQGCAPHRSALSRAAPAGRCGAERRGRRGQHRRRRLQAAVVGRRVQEQEGRARRRQPQGARARADGAEARQAGDPRSPAVPGAGHAPRARRRCHPRFLPGVGRALPKAARRSAACWLRPSRSPSCRT